MNLGALERFARAARTKLMREVADQLDRALPEQSLARREHPAAVRSLELALKAQGREKLIEQTAYTWFNRLCAFRFMDVQGYTAIKVVSCVDGNQPEILAEARNGVFDGEIDDESVKSRVRDLLAGRIPTLDPRADAYRILFTATCNAWQVVMPFLFEKIDDWTEILMPNDLLSEDSILADVRAALTEEDCQTIEVIGWLYQFYIGEKKDEIFEGLKKNVKISADNIPAATQLFTPNWIVKYLVQNSLGRLWLSRHPESRLREIMAFYVPDDPECAERPMPSGINSPEDIRLVDPCCGSGHMLVYAFELLMFMYEEAGYEAKEIPRLILEKNLHGIELDPRAAALTAFALTMKARAENRRFFKKEYNAQPNVLCLRNVGFEANEIASYREAIQEDLFTIDFLGTLSQFEDAENLGSLIVPELHETTEIRKRLTAKRVEGELFLHATHEKVLRVLEAAEYLSPRYHVVVTNPPYMGGKGMNAELKAFAEKNYPNSKSDLFAMFIERCLELCVKDGYASLVTMQSWMFLSSFEKLRENLLDHFTMMNLCHMGNMVMRIAFGTSATTWQKSQIPNYRAGFCYVDYSDLTEKGIPVAFPPDNERNRKASK